MTLSADAPNKTERTDETDNSLAVSNADFHAAVFDVVPEGARPGVVTFPGNPANMPGKVWFAHPIGASTPPTANNYFTLSSYYNDEAGQFRRTKKTFAALHSVMWDDLGTKVDIGRVTLPLSWLIETSPGNYQGGYILVEPINDASTANRLMSAIIGAGTTRERDGIFLNQFRLVTSITSMWITICLTTCMEVYRITATGLEPGYVWKRGGIRTLYWQYLVGGDGFYISPDSVNSRFGYGTSQNGDLYRYDKLTGYYQSISPPAPDLKTRLRFNWNAGFAQDPAHNSVAYYGSQFLHKTTDTGATWQIISPDLTTNNPEHQKQDYGGLTIDASGAEIYNSILSIAPSALDNQSPP